MKISQSIQSTQKAYPNHPVKAFLAMHNSSVGVPFMGTPTKNAQVTKGVGSNFISKVNDFMKKVKLFFQSLWNRLSGTSPEKEKTVPTPTEKDSTKTQMQELDSPEGHGSKGEDQGSKSTATQNTKSATSQATDKSKKMTNPEQAEKLFDKDLSDAQNRFIRNARNRSLPEGKRTANAIRYGSDVFNALVANLKRSQIETNAPLLKDVQHINAELEAIAHNVATKKTFGDLNDATQDRMINLIQFALKHDEPLVSDFGQELGESIGLSQQTIKALKTEL